MLINQQTASQPLIAAGDTARPYAHEFPGRWLGGAALVAAPLLMLLGVALRLGFDFFFPAQLAAYATHPTLIFTAYSLFAAGNLLLWPAIITLAQLIGAKRPGLALWGGAFAICGLFARTFHAGVDHLAFQMVRSEGAARAQEILAAAYGAFHIFHFFSTAILLGWIVLAIGAYRSGTLGLIGSIALGLMAALPLGVLKGSTPLSVVATAGLCVALMPLGVAVLRAGPRPGLRAAAGWALALLALAAIFFFLGEAG